MQFYHGSMSFKFHTQTKKYYSRKIIQQNMTHSLDQLFKPNIDIENFHLSKQILDESQTMTILSSFRNQSWLQPTNLDRNYIANIVDNVLTGFSEQYVQDVENLQLRTESGN